MDPGVTAAASGMTAFADAQEVLAHNLANVDTTGYKRRVAVIEPFLSYLDPSLGDRTGSYVGDVSIDFSQGPIEHTGNPFDLALGSRGFFAIEDQGARLYTRKGCFSANADGELVDSVGRPLLDEGGGHVKIPKNAREVRVDRDGRVSADGQQVGQLLIADIQDTSLLVPAPFTAFALPPSAGEPLPVEDAVVIQGALEGSNTNAVDELVQMIVTLRSFEASQRALASLDENSQQLTQAAMNSGS